MSSSLYYLAVFKVKIIKASTYFKKIACGAGKEGASSTEEKSQFSWIPARSAALFEIPTPMENLMLTPAPEVRVEFLIL